MLFFTGRRESNDFLRFSFVFKNGRISPIIFLVISFLRFLKRISFVICFTFFPKEKSADLSMILWFFVFLQRKISGVFLNFLLNLISLINGEKIFSSLKMANFSEKIYS